MDNNFGDVTELGDVGASPGKSYLFFLTDEHPGIRLSGDRVLFPAKHHVFAVSGALATTRENPGDIITFTPGRTHNRSRSPR